MLQQNANVVYKSLHFTKSNYLVRLCNTQGLLEIYVIEKILQQQQNVGSRLCARNLAVLK